MSTLTSPHSSALIYKLSRGWSRFCATPALPCFCMVHIALPEKKTCLLKRQHHKPCISCRLKTEACPSVEIVQSYAGIWREYVRLRLHWIWLIWFSTISVLPEIIIDQKIPAHVLYSLYLQQLQAVSFSRVKGPRQFYFQIISFLCHSRLLCALRTLSIWL